MSTRATTCEESPRALDAAEVPLTGLNVVEANAGTGKTWTITALYLRLLLEARLPVESILVVTFTEAATGELRDRIRSRIADARDACECPDGPPADAFIATLLARVGEPEDTLLRLTLALSDFDRAAIYTIHGFCQRVLVDGAFESAMPFRTEIIPDPSAILKEIVEDFWRKETQAASVLFTRYLVKEGISPGRLLDVVERYLGKPYLTIRAPAAAPPLRDLERMYERACGEARRIWLSEGAAIAAKLAGNTDLSGTTYRQASISGWLDEMHTCLSPESPQLELCAHFDKFTPSALAKGTKKGGVVPRHAFFEACQALNDTHAALTAAFATNVVMMRVRLLEFCNAELKARKERRQLLSYDDLLLNVQAALRESLRGEALGKALRDQYAAALIDEFQDTDPVQYDIFRRIYADSPQPVYLVGDPKQSIYSFRGADVYAYVAARREASARHTLDVNWRSDPALLGAVNQLFQHAPQPFVIPEIEFSASSPAPGSRGGLLLYDDRVAPFEIWRIESTNDKPVPKKDALQRAAQATAQEIARLLDLGDRDLAHIVNEDGTQQALKGGDIAVLTRSHRQATAVRDALAARGVASVQRGSQNVFLTREAEELERVLLAVAEPGRELLIGGALSTEIMGYSAGTLHALQADEAAWERVIESFREAHRQWHDAGFMRMLRTFAQTYRVLDRLLEYVDGERRVTNLLHLAELLHCDAERQGIAGVLTWLAEKRRAPAEANEAELLRLESDGNLVKLFTVHASKGLEFPLVFCPFAWDGGFRTAKAEVLAFHDAAENYLPVVDFGSPSQDTGRLQALQEERAESIRLFYVALTRAKYRCWIAWGDVNGAAEAAPAWLLHRRNAADEPQLSGMDADLARIAHESGGRIRVTPLPDAADASTLVRREETRLEPQRRFEGSVRDTRHVTSFTALTHGRSVEAPDYDAADREPLAESVKGRDIFAFPRGAQAGRCVHAIFENVDFARAARPQIDAVVSQALKAHGFDSVWGPAVGDMVESVLATPLDASGMHLAEIGRERRLDELEFYYPICRLDDAPLRSILTGHAFPSEIRERIGKLTFDHMDGYMRGFIDLVFEHGGRYYLVDYKSNWLGATPDAYTEAAVASAMGREAYYLQYLVYCVALHRYLALRVPDYSYESNFGGVRYLFVRAMRPDGGTRGVYTDRPPESLVSSLDHYLRTGAA